MLIAFVQIFGIPLDNCNIDVVGNSFGIGVLVLVYLQQNGWIVLVFAIDE
jgi:hypothetical protein